MKKWIALTLTLCLAVGATSAFAEGGSSGGSKQSGGGGGQGGGQGGQDGGQSKTQGTSPDMPKTGLGGADTDED